MPVAINPYNFIPFYGDSYNEPPKRQKLNEYYPEDGEVISVKMVVKDCVTRTLREDLTMSTQHIDIPACPPCSFDKACTTFKSILRMSDSTATEREDVAYLTGVDKRENEQIFSWFQQNRTNPNRLLTLPEPWESKLTLPTRRGSMLGKNVKGTVRRVLRNGGTYIRLDGSRTDGFYRQQYSERIKEGDTPTVHVESYDADHKTYRVRPV